MGRILCPFCDYSDEDLYFVELHVTREHPDWESQFKSKSALRRAIVMGKPAASPPATRPKEKP